MHFIGVHYTPLLHYVGVHLTPLLCYVGAHQHIFVVFRWCLLALVCSVFLEWLAPPYYVLLVQHPFVIVGA
jgi:hypothetical protein